MTTLKKLVLEFLRWHKWMGNILGAQGHGSPAQHSGLRILCLQLRSQLWLRSDPVSRNSICCGVAKKEKKKKKETSNGIIKDIREDTETVEQ